MATNLHEYRKSYEKGNLEESKVAEDPLKQFKIWFQEAEASAAVDEVNAMTLSTYGMDGYPRGRVVLLKQYDASGFVFYTNYLSDKGQAIEYNPHVCISFFWPQLERQIIIKGIATKTSEEESKVYFQSRPRESQLGALVSNQSAVIENRETLEHKLKALEETYKGKEIPKPSEWGGYRIEPFEFEFWQGRKSRLHDRLQYSLEHNEWVVKRLQP